MLRYLLSALLFSLSPAAAAEALPEPVGQLRNVVAPAYFVGRGYSTVAEPGQALVRGALLETGPHGALGITLDDGTRLTLGPNSRLRLDAFDYVPQRRQLRLELWLERGSLILLAGEIARLAPGRLRVDSPGGAVNVLGPAEMALRISR